MGGNQHLPPTCWLAGWRDNLWNRWKNGPDCWTLCRHSGEWGWVGGMREWGEARGRAAAPRSGALDAADLVPPHTAQCV